jgi:hypothetical protein
MLQTQTFWRPLKCSLRRVKHLSAAAVVICTHRAGIVPPDECEREIKSESDVHMVQNWQNVCQKMGDVATVEEFVGDDIVPEILTKKQGIW